MGSFSVIARPRGEEDEPGPQLVRRHVITPTTMPSRKSLQRLDIGDDQPIRPAIRTPTRTTSSRWSDRSRRAWAISDARTTRHHHTGETEGDVAGAVIGARRGRGRDDRPRGGTEGEAGRGGEGERPRRDPAQDAVGQSTVGAGSRDVGRE